MSFYKKKWMWKLCKEHLLTQRGSRPAVRWMNRFAFVGIFIGVFAWTSVASIMSGLQKKIKERILSEGAHLVWEGAPQQGLEKKWLENKNLFERDVSQIQFLLQSEGLLELSSHEQEGRISGTGVIVQGVDSLEGSENADLGAELFANLSLSYGENFKLMSPWRMDLPPLDLQVRGTFQSGSYETDAQVLRISKSYFQKWLGIPDSVSRIEIALKAPLEAEFLKSKIENVFGVVFKTWAETQSSLWYSLKLEKVTMRIVTLFLVFMAALSVHLAMSVRVAEKSREIALLQALGAQKKDLATLYLWEGTLIGFFASCSALFVSFGFCKFISESKFFLLPDVFYSREIPVDWDWTSNTVMMLTAVFLCVLATWSPARRVMRIDIQESLRS